MLAMLHQVAQRVRFGSTPALAKSSQAVAATDTKSILVADDDEAMRIYVRLVLGGLGYEVLDAADGPAAIDILRDRRHNPVDLLMTDLMMPAMSGKDLADRLWRRFPMQRVLFFSGYPEQMARRLWKLDAGMTFLQKPFSSIDLATKVAQMLDQPARFAA